MNPRPTPPVRHHAAFALPDLLGVILALTVVALLLLPRWVHAATGSATASCLANLQSLANAWTRHALDQEGRFVNNLSVTFTQDTVARRKFDTWANNVLDWGNTPGNTNETLMAAGPLGPYLTDPVSVFRCPADTYISPFQRSRGWARRVRSYSMNGFFGLVFSSVDNASEAKGINPFYGDLRQFRQFGAVSRPDSTFVFLDEHPDSINDGVFFNNPAPATSWGDIPANYHDGGLNLTFADGHAEHHPWLAPTNLPAVRYQYTSPTLRGAALEDRAWLVGRQSVPTRELLATRAPSNELRIAWSQLADSIVPQACNDPAAGGWTNLNVSVTRTLGLKSVTVPPDSEARFFRLRGP